MKNGESQRSAAASTDPPQLAAAAAWKGILCGETLFAMALAEVSLGERTMSPESIASSAVFSWDPTDPPSSRRGYGFAAQ